jgi:adenylosuccinate lyase
MTDTLDHGRWLSPLAWRYGSEAMRALWSERHKRILWRRLWVALASAQADLGLLARTDADQVAHHALAIDIPAAEALERTLRHDLMAELTVFAAQCGPAGGILHLGATSMDIEDNADALRLRDGLQLVRAALHGLIGVLAELTERHADTTAMGFTHLQPAEPTTLGHRFAQWLQDLVADAEQLGEVVLAVRGKGLRGAVGTAASYVELMESEDGAAALERAFMQKLGLETFPVSTQTYPRKQDHRVVTALADLGQSLYRLAYDIRILQNPMIGELAEPFGAQQIGSSAMPFKRNPVATENIDSLARQLAALPRVTWDNAAHSHLERTLDDSANRRSVLPEAFLLADALVARTRGVLEGLVVRPSAMAATLARFGPFAGTERVLMAAVKAGGDRQVLHGRLREHAMAAWQRVEAGMPLELGAAIAGDPDFARLLSPDDIATLLDATQHTGRAASLARATAEHARQTLARLEEACPVLA